MDSQQHELLRAGVPDAHLYADIGVSGRGDTQRPVLRRLIAEILREGDELVVFSLSRLGRSVKDLLIVLDELQAKGVEVRSLSEGVSTGQGAVSRLVTTLLAAVGEMEREMIIERTKSGLAAARAKGRTGGRPALLSAQRSLDLLAAFNVEAEKRSRGVDNRRPEDIATEFGVSRSVAFRYRKAAQKLVDADKKSALKLESLEASRR